MQDFYQKINHVSADFFRHQHRRTHDYSPAIPIPTATAIPRNVEDNVYASIHKPRIVNNNILISKIEDSPFAKRHSENDNDNNYI